MPGAVSQPHSAQGCPACGKGAAALTGQLFVTRVAVEQPPSEAGSPAPQGWTGPVNRSNPWWAGSWRPRCRECRSGPPAAPGVLPLAQSRFSLVIPASEPWTPGDTTIWDPGPPLGRG